VIAAHREVAEYAKSGMNMMVWWFNPDAGDRYINSAPASPEELENARSRLRTLVQWLRDIAAQVEVRLDADKPGSVVTHGGRR
jgi:hypothetical protein